MKLRKRGNKSKLTISGKMASAYDSMRKAGLFHEEEIVQRWLVYGLEIRSPKEVYEKVKSWFEKQEPTWQLDPTYEVACKKGCSYCCHLNVDIFDFEAIAIRDHLKHYFSKDEIAMVKERAEKKFASTGGLAQEDRLGFRIPCPLLDMGGNCMVYESRPMNCRKFYSVDVTACEYGYNHPEDRDAQNPFWSDPRKLGDDIEAGLTMAIMSKGKARSGIKTIEEHLVNKL